MLSSSEMSVKVDKATSNLLIGPDWTVNMEICDSVNSNQWQPKDVIKSVKKRLQHKYPRVQFLALTLLETLIKNCGDLVHFQVVEREILQEMIKIVKKKTDMQVRDKILLLLDSWQEAFGGPQGRFPQYYFAYAELKNSGVHFPQKSGHSAPVFTPPITRPPPGRGMSSKISITLDEAMASDHSAPVFTPPITRPPPGRGMSSKISITLDEAMASDHSDVGNLSLSGLDSIQTFVGLLSDMLQAVNSNDSESVKDEVIADLISQCRSNQKKMVDFVGSTRDEQMLAKALELNDNLQYLIAKHDAIASGSAIPITRLEAPSASEYRIQQVSDEEEEDDDDGFADLAQRNSKIKTDQNNSSTVVNCDHEASPTTLINSASKAQALSSAMANTLVLTVDQQADPVSKATKTKELGMIDLLSMTLSTANTSSSAHIPPQIPASQSTTPSYNYNKYVAPWAQQTLPQPPWQQPQYQYSQYSSSFPSPPWESSSSTALHDTNIIGNQTPPVSAPPPESRHNIVMAASAVSTTTPAANSRPFVPSYRLFEDLIDLRTADGGIKTTKGTASAFSSKKTE